MYIHDCVQHPPQFTIIILRCDVSGYLVNEIMLFVSTVL